MHLRPQRARIIVHIIIIMCTGTQSYIFFYAGKLYNNNRCIHYTVGVVFFCVDFIYANYARERKFA